MATKIPRWAKICGIGCGSLALLLAGLLTVGFFAFRGLQHSFETADRSFDEVAQRLGPVSAFHPGADGAIPPERIESFLRVRERTAVARRELERTLEVLSGGAGSAGDESALAGFRRMRAVVRVSQLATDFHSSRNQALLEAGIGLGEYYYIYSLAYYSSIGADPSDGPSFTLVGEKGYIFETIEDLDEAAVREYRSTHARTGLNRLLLPVLRNQLADLAGSGSNPSGGSWRRELALEIEALEADPERLPWQDGLPQVIASSLDPYRNRLEQQYSRMCNALEAGVVRRHHPPGTDYVDDEPQRPLAPARNLPPPPAV